MERPGPALIGSVVVHAAAVGVVLLAMMGGVRPPRQIVNAVPVSIVSEQMVLAGPADAPSDEPAEDVEAAPPAEAPEPVPEPPAPTPRPPEKTVAPRPTPQPTPPPRPTPQPKQRETPPSRPAPTPPPKQREAPRPPREESLDLGKLAAERPNTSPNRGNRPPAGQQGQGQAPRAVGRASLQALGAQVRPRLNCDLPGASSTTVRVVVRLSESGRIVGSPRLQGDRNPISESVLRAIQAAEPFDMPADYEEQDIPFVFNTSSWC